MCSLFLLNSDPSCGRNVQGLDKIVNGDYAFHGEFPWMVSLMEEDTFNPMNFLHTCGGSIIAPKWILTAAQCLYYSRIPFK